MHNRRCCRISQPPAVDTGLHTGGCVDPLNEIVASPAFTLTVAFVDSLSILEPGRCIREQAGNFKSVVQVGVSCASDTLAYKV